MTTAWVVRTGKYGERDDWALSSGFGGGGWVGVADLTAVTSREGVAALVAQAYPNDKPRAVATNTAQLWALRSRIEPGDLLVLPLKTTSQVALGRVTGGYEYRDDPDPSRRHVVRVDWQRTDVPRTAIKQDLLFILGAFLTVFQPTRNDAVWRLKQVLATGADPGARADQSLAAQVAAGDLDALESDLEAGTADLEENARTRIQTLIQEGFAGHDMARLVEAVLTVEGFVCERKGPGADGGVDILAGRGVLGLDPPRLVVQVKSESTPVGDPVVQTLQGAITRFSADQALLVAWGGVNKQADKFLETTKFTIRVWDAADLIEALLRVYPRLPEAIRSELPLKQIWVPAVDSL
ncbi:MAG: restriction endonuclease [Actinomycetales bacterium]|nr:restriction endonuclease [Actinomycetales bacterium]